MTSLRCHLMNLTHYLTDFMHLPHHCQSIITNLTSPQILIKIQTCFEGFISIF